MNATNQDTLKRIVRGCFGPAEMRFYDNSVTVTLIRDFGKYSLISDLHNAVNSLLTEHGLDRELDVEIVSANRFKLREVSNEEAESRRIADAVAAERFAREEQLDLEDEEDEEDEEQETDRARSYGLDAGDGYDGMIGAVRDAVDIAHEESMLKKALIKSIERDTEDFLMKNLGAALVILGEENARVISLDQTKELMRFSYLSGLWANARERDLEPLIEAFNGKFKKYAEQWQINEVSDDEAGHG